VTGHFSPRELMAELALSGVDFVVVGGIAAAAWGSLRETTDLDVLCASNPENRACLAQSLTRLRAVLRGSRNPPRTIEPQLLEGISVCAFQTDRGELDVIFDALGFTYDTVVEAAVPVTVEGTQVRFADIGSLIDMKTTAGRPKDRDVVAELEALRELGVTLTDAPGRAGGAS
jgi:hypothetical protein